MQLASSELVEKESTEEVCKLIKEHFPSVKMQPDCETVVSALWDKIKAQCPKGKESFLASPSPQDIEKLVCKLASSELIEKEATEEVCKIIKERFPSVKMQPDCRRNNYTCNKYRSDTVELLDDSESEILNAVESLGPLSLIRL